MIYIAKVTAPIWLAVLFVVAFALLSGCSLSRPTMPRGGEIRLPGNMVVRQPENAAAPATAKIIYAVTPEVDQGSLLPVFALASGPKDSGATGSVRRIELSTGTPEVTDTTAIETTKAELSARQPLLYIGAACILAGLLIATLLHYPTPGGMTALAGGALIGAHTYPWLGVAAAALLAAAVAMYIGHEIGERKTSSPTPAA